MSVWISDVSRIAQVVRLAKGVAHVRLYFRYVLSTVPMLGLFVNELRAWNICWAFKSASNFEFSSILHNFTHRKTELPRPIEELKTADGKPIKMYYQEVIEDGDNLQSVPINSIVSKCSVINADRCESAAAKLRKHKETRENHDIYICRYKLIKQTTYVLMPVSWKAEGIDERTELARHREVNNVQCADEQNEYAPDDPLADHHYELVAHDSRLVSPIKIINKTVHKAKRPSPENYQRSNIGNGDDDDDSVYTSSPSKRSKRENEMNGNYLQSSPKTTGTPHSSKKHGVRKNLNSSFTNSAANDSDANENMPDVPQYKAQLIDEFGIKLKISDTRKYVIKQLIAVFGRFILKYFKFCICF